MHSFTALSAPGLATLPLLVSAQSSCGPSPSGSIQPSLASGYRMQVVATGLSSPRGIILDGSGNLLVVEQDRGLVSAHTLGESNGCVTVQSSRDVTPALDVRAPFPIARKSLTQCFSSTMASKYRPMVAHYMHPPPRQPTRSPTMLPHRLCRIDKS